MVRKLAAVRTLVLDGRQALLVRPRGARHILVLAHGAGAGMRHAFMEELAGALAARRVATLRWEFPYMAAGRARPDRAAVAEAAVRATWRAAAASAHVRGLAMLAGGKSFGGRMTSQAHAAEPLPGARGLVFLGFPLRSEPARAAHLARAGGPMLFVQGTRDELADLGELRPIVAALGARATLHVVDGADHGFAVLRRSGRGDAEVMAELAGAIAAWADIVAP
jgi:hypothetical protein